MGWAETTRDHRESRAARHRWESATSGARHVLRPTHPRRATACPPGCGRATIAELCRKVPRAPGSGARVESPRSESQANAVAFLVERDVIDQVADDEQPPPEFALQVLRAGGVRRVARVEAGAVIDDVDAHDIAPQLDADAHDAVGVLAVAVADRVAESFGEG